MSTPDTFHHRHIEAKWQERWAAASLFATPTLPVGAAKAYILDFFPYPSGSGLHVGHLLGYTGSDVAARVARKQGKQVLHPMGWDAFGLPAENYAIKHRVHPAVTTAKSIAEFKRQFRQVGISYDWDREINTSDPSYYRWTQWFFRLMYERGLAYRKEGPVNWCPSCQTVLANEQVVGEGTCERCGTTVVQRQLKQWFFKITYYADRLLEGLDRIDWPEKIKLMQRNWIGRSEGARLRFTVAGKDESLEVFTTRPETVFGATFMVLAPEHPLVASITTPDQAEAVARYQETTARKNELERTFLDKEKTGVFTGAQAINPATGAAIPIWVADYVLGSYGTGAIMAVPAHDERDYAFAVSHNLSIVAVLETGGAPLPVTDLGPLAIDGISTLQNHPNAAAYAKLNGRTAPEVLDDLLAIIGGTKEVTYRLRDWLVSRQRFWGAPIPVVYDEKGEEHLLPDSALPVTLPTDIAFEPHGRSPLHDASEWKVYTDPVTGTRYTREVDTLDTFVCSSWYYLRFANPHYTEGAFDPEAVKAWLPVDLYIGGAEHAVLHLLYARFFTKVLFDAGLVPFDEPFQALRNPGMVLGPDHNKMSKSKGNVINPDDVIAEYGADCLRLYELFMAPFDLEKPWSTKGIIGVRRFLEKVWRLREHLSDAAGSADERALLHRTMKKVSEDVPEFKFNTAIAAMMEAVNAWGAQDSISRETYQTFLSLLNPFAPHLTEEIWEQLKGDGFCSQAAWPTFDVNLTVHQEVEYAVQVNGKVRAKLHLATGLPSEAVLAAVKADARIAAYLAGKAITKEVVVPDRLVSLVVT